MTTYTISETTYPIGSTVAAQYSAPDDTSWVTVWFNNNKVDEYDFIITGDFSITIERSTDGSTWERAGYGRWNEYATIRDGGNPIKIKTSVNQDGYIYRAIVTTDTAETIHGAIEFDTTTPRVDFDVGSGVGIHDCSVCIVEVPGGHFCTVKEVSTAVLDADAPNSAAVLLSAEHYYVRIPDSYCPVPGSIDGKYCHYNKHTYWGSDELSNPSTTCPLDATNLCDAHVHGVYELSPESNEYFTLLYHSDAEDDAGIGASVVMAVGLVLENVNQTDPVRDTYENTKRYQESGGSGYLPSEPEGEIVLSHTLTTSSGDLSFWLASILNTSVVNYLEESGVFPVNITGTTELVNYPKIWDDTVLGTNDGISWTGGTDQWREVVTWNKASGSSVSPNITVYNVLDLGQPYFSSGALTIAFGGIVFSETQYCHHVAVETPGDPADLPDADQIRAGNDGFDSPALDYQKRGPSEDGTVYFDPFSDESIEPGTDITLCFVWEDESVPVYYELTTAGAVYHVAVETPADPGDRPDSAQIKAGTDGFDVAALDVQIKTLPGSSGTLTFDAFAGGSANTNYTLCFVYADEAPVYYEFVTQAIIDIPAGALRLTGVAPSTGQFDPTLSEPVPPGSLHLTGYAPEISLFTRHLPMPIPPANLYLNGLAPDFINPHTISEPIPSNVIHLSAYAPGFSIPRPAEQQPAGSSKGVQRRRVIIGNKAFWVENNAQLSALLQEYLMDRREQLAEIDTLPKDKQKKRYQVLKTQIAVTENRISQINDQEEEELILMMIA